jgi:hypothetical protein
MVTRGSAVTRGSIPTFASHLPQLRLQMLDSQEPRETLTRVELKNLTFENELRRNRASNVKFAPRPPLLHAARQTAQGPRRHLRSGASRVMIGHAPDFSQPLD